MDLFTYAMVKKGGGGGGTVPTKLSQLENDVGFVTAPLTKYIHLASGGNVFSDQPGYIGGTNACGMMREATAEEYARIEAACTTYYENEMYMPDKDHQLLKGAFSEGFYMMGYNIKGSEEEPEPQFGVDIDDPTKHCRLLLCYPDEESTTGYILILASDISTLGDWSIYWEGKYQPELTFDAEPTEHSDNPVTSKGIKNAIDAAKASIASFSFYVCENGEYDAQTLVPTLATPDKQHIYLVPDNGNYREYLWLSGSNYDLIGTTEIDLTGYATTAAMNTALAGKSDTGHTHDGRYYTETEVDTALAGKSDTGHTHDSRYYTETEVDTALAGKSDTGHTHAYSAITGKPTNLVTGKNSSGTAQAFEIRLSTSAPASGTGNDVITIVIPAN